MAWGAARKKCAAEIKPIEPVWVIPAKGAAADGLISHIGRKPRVAIIGAGVVGLGIAWRLAGRASVTVFDRGRAGAGASHAAAGMLAACCEAEPGEEALVALGRESQARWPGFAEELGRASGIDVELRTEGTLVLALTADDQGELAHRLEFQRQKLDLPLEWLSAAATRAKEPHLAGKLAGAVFSPQDHQVDNRKLVQALRIAAEAAGVAVHEHRPVKEIVVHGGRAGGVLFEDGPKEPADIVVLAAGAWSRSIAGLPPDRRPPVRPVKGQMLALRMDPKAPLLNHVLWAPGAYLVPRRDGRLIVGGTVEEKGFDETITAGGVMALLDAAWRAVPAVEELPIDEIWVGHRSGQPRRRANPRARSAGKPVLRDRAPPQRHFADANHGRCDGAAYSRRRCRPGNQAVRAGALSAGAGGRVGRDHDGVRKSG